MKLSLTLLSTILSASLWAQTDTTAKVVHTAPLSLPTYKRHSIIATASLGAFDQNRHTYSLPSGFSKGTVSGFIPFFAKLEYGLTDDISVAATFGYDAFVYNIKQDFTGNNGPFSRYHANNTRIFSGGLTAYYHFGNIINAGRFDPFIGLGLSLNNIRYKEYPQGDTTAIKIDHTITAYLKLGTRYYLSDRFSLFADLGYDMQSYFTIGASCRFYHKRSLSLKKPQ